MNERIFYIAGLLDSGCFITIERQGKYYRAVLTISRSAAEILNEIKDVYGGQLSPYKNGFKLRLKALQVRRLLADVSPVMKTKRKEIDIILRLHRVNGQIRIPGEAQMLYEAIRGR